MANRQLVASRRIPLDGKEAQYSRVVKQNALPRRPALVQTRILLNSLKLTLASRLHRHLLARLTTARRSGRQSSFGPRHTIVGPPAREVIPRQSSPERSALGCCGGKKYQRSLLGIAGHGSACVHKQQEWALAVALQLELFKEHTRNDTMNG